MRLFAIASILIAATGLCQAQVEVSAENSTENADNHWCGKWAGSPNPADAPSIQQLPQVDYTRRFFVEPQLQRTPFAPIVATEPKVQIPKIWGNSMICLSRLCVIIAVANSSYSPDEFRVALLSYAGRDRVYASSKSRWNDFNEGLGLVMETCVRQGTGGAYLVPRKLPPVFQRKPHPFAFGGAL